MPERVAYNADTGAADQQHDEKVEAKQRAQFLGDTSVRAQQVANAQLREIEVHPVPPSARCVDELPSDLSYRLSRAARRT